MTHRLLLGVLCVGACAWSPAVRLPGLGRLHGAVSDFSQSVAVFRGVPYAEPPVGDLRWRSTQALRKGWGPRARPAAEFGNACLAPWAEKGMSEDCLYLNVAVPRRSLRFRALQRRKLPMLVYIHGGAYRNGDSKDHPIDSVVAQRPQGSWPLVAASLNYRLNIFGFLGSEALRSRTENGATGNYGLDDQRMALRFLGRYAGAFGADAARITIFGESAGGNSVLNHLVQPASFGLYAQAIIESGGYNGNVPLVDAEATYRQLLNGTSCEDLECLLAKPAEELEACIDGASAKSTTGPVIDGVSVTEMAQLLVRSGEYNREVPVLIGSNSDEMAYWFADVHPPVAWTITEGAFNKTLPFLLPTFTAEQVEEVKRLYTPDTYDYPEDLGHYSTWWWRAMRMATDGQGSTGALGHCSVRYLARSLVAGGTPGVFTYHFSHPTQTVEPDLNLNNFSIPGTGRGSPVAPHASELPYVFGYTEVLSDEGAPLGKKVAALWRDFAINGRSSTAWPDFGFSNETVLQLDSQGRGGIRPVQGLRGEACDFWDRQLPSMTSVPLDLWFGGSSTQIVV